MEMLPMTKKLKMNMIHLTQLLLITDSDLLLIGHTDYLLFKSVRNQTGSPTPTPLTTKKSKVKWVMLTMKLLWTLDLLLLVVSGLIIQLLLTNTLAP
jgi:hypothetical protein